jgi:hypothetical protein
MARGLTGGAGRFADCADSARAREIFRCAQDDGKNEDKTNCEETAMRSRVWQAGAQPFDSELPNLRMNRAVARFTSSAPA